MYEIKYEFNHYIVMKDDVFICSADTFQEAEAEIKEQDNKQL